MVCATTMRRSIAVGAGVERLMDKFNLDLFLVAHLGGHSAPRTHRGKERFPGMTVTYALIQMVERTAEKSNRGKITTDGACAGCIYEKSGADCEEFGPVIFASGGFGDDLTQNSLLATHRLDSLHLSMPTEIRGGEMMWNVDGKEEGLLASIPDRGYGGVLDECVEFCKKNGAFDPNHSSS